MFAIFESVLSKPHEAKSLREKLLGKKKISNLETSSQRHTRLRR